VRYPTGPAAAAPGPATQARRCHLRGGAHSRARAGATWHGPLSGQRPRCSLGSADAAIWSHCLKAAPIDRSRPVTVSSAGSIFGLGVLSLINFVNYLDRYIVAGVVPLIEAELRIDHGQAGLLLSIFMVVYMLASPIGGYLGDRIPRRFLVAAGVFIWSLATVGSGLARTFGALLLARAIVGIGEAGYGTVAPAVISDLFPRSMRTRMLAFFYVALPVGAAAGYAIGGWVGKNYSWHTAFFVGGGPGLALALLALLMPEPRRGATEDFESAAKIPFKEGLGQLIRNKMFWIVTSGLTLMTFSIGGLANWMPTFLNLERGMSLDHAGVVFGAITAVAGMLGTFAGGVLGDLADRRHPNGGIWVSGLESDSRWRRQSCWRWPRCELRF